jgi:hypothetical protein
MIKGILCIITVVRRAFQSIWFIHEYNFEWKDDLKSAHDYSYESGSYSFKVKCTVIAEPTVLQKTFMCNNCLTLRHYYSYDWYHIG